MAARFLFPCPHCGHLNTIAQTMAGQETSCSQCSQSFEIPQLKILRQCKLADAGEEPAKKIRSSGNALKNAFFVFGFLLASLGIFSGIGLYYYGKSMVTDLASAKDTIEREAAKLSPGAVLREWYNIELKPDLPEWREHPLIRYRNQGKILQRISYLFFALGGTGIVMLCSSFALGNRRQRTK